jgi:hypothetical protein
MYSLLTDASIQKQIVDEIAKYDADKLGMPDYALESSGENMSDGKIRIHSTHLL